MAKDNSLIVVPPIATVSAIQKIDPTLVSQDVTFNNGLFILNKSSLSATFPKSLYKVWKKNLINIIENANIRQVVIMMTINSLCLFSITEFLDDMLKIKEQYGGHKLIVDFI